MRLDLTAAIPFPRERVFAAYRDNLPELVPYLGNVRSITVKQRSEEGPVVKLLNLWKGGGDIPAVVRKFLSDDLLQWDDHATWNQAEWTCDWQTVVPAFKDAVDARGHNTYTDEGTTTLLRISGELKVDARKVRGVPSILASSIGPTIEAFLVAAIKPNLFTVAKGVEKYLRERQ